MVRMTSHPLHLFKLFWYNTGGINEVKTMSKPVKLSKIIEGMEFQTDEIRSFLETETDEVVSISDDDVSAAEEEDYQESYPVWQHNLIQKAKQILDDAKGGYIALPSSFDIDEYRMMEKFALSFGEEISNCLYTAIKGRRAFRRFKDEVARLGIEKDWHKFRDKKYKELTREWCEDNSIKYIDDL